MEENQQEENKENQEIQETEVEVNMESLSTEDTAVEDKEEFASEEKSLSEKELDNRKNSAQERINTLTRKRREAEEREAAALQYAEAMKKKAEDLEQRSTQVNQGYATEFEGRVASQEDQAKKALADATEINDPIKIAEATSALAKVEIEKERLRVYKNKAKTKPRKEEYITPNVNPQANTQPAPPPDPKATSWAEKNTWFGEDKNLTAVAFNIHNDLIEQGFDGSTDGYYEELNSKLKPWLSAAGFNTEEEEEVVSKKTSNVAPVNSGRGVAKKPKSVKLTRSQVEIAKRLGVPNDKYAEELLKLQGTRK
tara:strand:+ start:865 stop:1797 length:933 start_codon:yes stop_codon:yes gene_type:complete